MTRKKILKKNFHLEKDKKMCVKIPQGLSIQAILNKQLQTQRSVNSVGDKGPFVMSGIN